MASVREKNDIGLTTSAIINDWMLSVQSKADNCQNCPFELRNTGFTAE